jgi:hypothetical protein
MSKPPLTPKAILTTLVRTEGANAAPMEGKATRAATTVEILISESQSFGKYAIYRESSKRIGEPMSSVAGFDVE